jgi:hypothetical protein
MFPDSNWNCKKEDGLSFERYIYTLKPNPINVTKNSSHTPLLRHIVKLSKLQKVTLVSNFQVKKESYRSLLTR